MNALINRLVDPVPALGHSGNEFMPLAARLVFAGTLFMYFWSSAKTKLAGVFTIDFGAYAQIFPKKFEAVGYDLSQMSALDSLIVYAAAYGEFVLPLLIVIGLFTRLSALGMIVFVIVQSLTDIYGHGVDEKTIGAWFDRFSDSLIVDQRSLWVFLFLYLIFYGAGSLSVDRVLGGRAT
ncbi:MAG: DoxX family protein [Pseudomonadota bacterium]